MPQNRMSVSVPSSKTPGCRLVSVAAAPSYRQPPWVTVVRTPSKLRFVLSVGLAEMRRLLPMFSSCRPKRALMATFESRRDRTSTKPWWTSNEFWSVGRGPVVRPLMIPLWNSE